MQEEKSAVGLIIHHTKCAPVPGWLLEADAHPRGWGVGPSVLTPSLVDKCTSRQSCKTGVKKTDGNCNCKGSEDPEVWAGD